MKATGIVRRIDDLGRVVIPKEIRRTMKIREGDPLEIFTDKDGFVCLKKYTVEENVGQIAENLAESAQEMLEGISYENENRAELKAAVDEMSALVGKMKRLQKTYENEN